MTTQTVETRSKAPYEILVGLDFSELSTRAFEEAISLARNHETAELHAVVVGAAQAERVRLPGFERSLEFDEARETARQRIADLVEAYRSKNGKVPLERVAVYVLTGEPSTQLLAIAEALDVDLIVVGTHGRRGVNRILLGSVAEDVVRRASTGVYVVRPADFVRGEKVPAIEPPLESGQSHLRPWARARTYHYVDRNVERPAHLLEVT